MRRSTLRLSRLALLAVAALGVFTLPGCLHHRGHHGFFNPFRHGHRDHHHDHHDDGGARHHRRARRSVRRARRR